MKYLYCTLLVISIFLKSQAQSPIIWQEMLSYKNWDAYTSDTTVLNIKMEDMVNH
jgi:hypothetical protein